MSRRKTALALVGGAVAAALALSGCASSKLESNSGATTLTFWTRANSADFDKKIVAAYNASHDTKVTLTVVPNDLFVTKFGSAAGSGQAPDLAAVDVIYMPNFNKAHQFQDLTSKIDALPFKNDLVKAHLKLSTVDGKTYAVPHNVDASALFYNKSLFKAAGLDPEKPPTTWAEIHDDAAKISALGNDTYGYYFGGACAGCQAYGGFPMIWASGGSVLNEDGTKATLDSPAVRDYLTWNHQMLAQKLVPPSAATENGSTWQSSFLTGKVGMVGLGTFAIAGMKAQTAFDWGIAPLPGKNGGGTASFVGGDTIGIPAGSKHSAEAWDFIKWSLSDDAQINVVSKNGALTARTDLADNKYTKEDPRLLVNNKMLETGQTPYSLAYNALINDANGPWNLTLRKGIVEGDVDAAVTQGQEAMTKILNAG